MPYLRFLAVIPLLVGPVESSVSAVEFVRDIQPILAERCYHCHGEDAQEGRLRLDAKRATLAGGISGPAVIAGQPTASPLFVRVAGDEDGDRMPLEEDPLSEQEIALLRAWIEQGAPWPDGIGAEVETAEPHWAYVPPHDPRLPQVPDTSWPKNAIDYFVLNRLQAQGMSPSLPAEKATLLRRLFLDLIGIPPSVTEVDQFLADDRPGAYERAVDRLLASPQYGVRWARPWLDAARYADSNGYQADQFRDVWPYRDWVINAMNADMPFDRFTRDQLAGDLLPNPTVDQQIATGFSRLTTCNVEAGVDPEENRVNQVIDRVNTTGTVWLGTTLECAQCHNHKYDPITQRAYYQVFAYFNNTPLEVEGNGVTYNFVGPKMELPLDGAQSKRRSELQAERARLQKEREIVVERHLSEFTAWEVRLSDKAATANQWQVLSIREFHSSGGASHTILEDQSVLVSGKLPDKDDYTVTVDTDLASISAVRLQTLTHDSLPDGGPGRFERPNFVLHEFQVSALPRGADASTQHDIRLHSAAADFSQRNYDVGQAIDGDISTAWAVSPQFGQPHTATFLLHEPLQFGDGGRLSFVLKHRYGGGRTIGRLKLSVWTGDPTQIGLPQKIEAIARTPAADRTEAQQQELKEHYLQLDPQIRELDTDLQRVQAELKSIEATTTLVMVEAEPRETMLFRRGDFLQPGSRVEPQPVIAISPTVEGAPANRLGLSEWLVRRENPLTARVTVNRWWAAFMGRGLVESLEDFGTQSLPPSHPQLLDWLAIEFMESGWSMKHVHKQIVMSATYQQSAEVSKRHFRRDPLNQWYARSPRFRLSAEAIRDNALAISGLLSLKLGGPPVFPPQPENVWRHVGRNAPKYATSTGTDRYRRGIYVVWRRSAPYPSFTTFDAPDRAACVVDRARTNTPLQALTLLNDPAYTEMALGLAKRILNNRPGETIAAQARYAWRLVLSREPNERELNHLVEVYEREFRYYQQREKAAQRVVGAVASQHTPAKVAAWFFVANILLNLDETITKG